MKDTSEDEIVDFGPELHDLEDFDDIEQDDSDGLSPPHRRLTRRLVPPEFRELVLNRYPVLRNHEGYRCLMQQLLFPDNYNHKPDKFGVVDKCILLCNCDILAYCEDKYKQCKSRNFVGKNFIWSFRNEVLPEFRWYPYSKEYGLCRRVRKRGVDQDILEARYNWSFINKDEWVYFDDGYKRRKQHQANDKKALLELANHLVESKENVDVRRLLVYMNNRNIRSFRIDPKYMDEAYAHVLSIEDVTKRESALNTLLAIASQPKPFYQPTTKGKTTRIFPLNLSLLNLQKDIRRILTRDWIDYDLKSAQLAIIAKLWELENVLKFLEERKSIWTSLFDHMGFDRSIPLSTVKPDLKDALYALVYGKERNEFERDLFKQVKEFITNPTEKFFSHPIIEVVFRTREKELERIVENGGAEDSFGEWIPINPKQKPKKAKRSVMSIVAQSFELKLLLPVVELAERTNDFNILLWQHDGFSVKYTDRTKKNTWHNKILKSVKSEAKRLQIPTYLEFDETASMNVL